MHWEAESKKQNNNKKYDLHTVYFTELITHAVASY